jgi:aminoglycoside phosphotransferase (APT) family kinase protein
MIASPTTAVAVSESLRDYLRFNLSVDEVNYSELPTGITTGWETHIYRFQLRDSDELPRDFLRPLVLRVYSSISGLPRLEHEASVQSFLHARGYPVARPLLLEKSDSVLGGPFMLMELLPGRTLLDELFSRFWRIVHAPVEMAEMQARLHRMPVDRFPAPPGDFLQRQLQNMHELIEEFDLESLRPGVDWLETHRPPAPERASILHLDFHPINMLCRWRRCTGILDWSDADVGDRHADVAASIVRMRSAPLVLGATLWQKLNLIPGRWLFWKYYLFAYRRRLPLDEQRLAYFMAWAALRRLCLRGACLKASPLINGWKSALRHYLTMERVDYLTQFFYAPSGILLRFEL